MKKVLLSAYACSPIKGSEESRGWNWAVGLAQKGYQVWCVTNVEDKIEIEAQHKALSLPNLHFVFIGLPFNMDERLLKPSNKSIYLHYNWWQHKAVKIVTALHSEQKFDVAHHISYGSVQQGSCIYNLKNCNVIYGPVGGGQMALDSLKPYFEGDWKTEVIRGFISKLLFQFSGRLKKTLRRANHVIATNPETKELLINSKLINPAKVHLSRVYAIPKMYNDLPYIEKDANNVLRLIWVGRLLPRKGLNLSLHALSFLPKDYPYTLTIVGDGEQMSMVDDWMSRYNLDSKKVKFLGRIPYKNVAKEYRKADVMLFCSLRDTSGTQIMEAMAYSLPLIVLNISGARNLIPQNCAIKIDPTPNNGTAKDIAKAIEKMNMDSEFRKKCAKNAYKHAMKSTMEHRINDIVDEYY